MDDAIVNATEGRSSAFGGEIAAMQERPQPHDTRAERAVLAAMLKEEICVDIVIENLGEKAEIFYSHIHREIFEAILEVHRDPEKRVDMLVVIQRLMSRGTLERVGGDVFVAELFNAVATTAALESWCKILKDYYALRQMIAVCTDSLSKCYDPDSSAIDLVESVEKQVFEVRHVSEKSQIVSLKENIASTFERILEVLDGKVKPGISTGFRHLDQLTGGLKPAEMFVLAARPSIGKTAIALNIVRNIALGGENVKVAFFSLEMSAEQITRRLICTEADVPESSFGNRSFPKSDFTKLTQAVSALREANIFIDPTPALTIGSLQARARRLKMMHGIDVVVIDYLQLMKAGHRVESRQNEVAEISSGIKQLAKDLNVPVLVLAQLNRESEKGTDPNALPKLSHLRESGAIEQDADVVTFLHRNRDEGKDMTPEQAAAGVAAKLIVEKNRNGATGIVDLRFYPRRMLFGTPAREFEEKRT